MLGILAISAGRRGSNFNSYIKIFQDLWQIQQTSVRGMIIKLDGSLYTVVEFGENKRPGPLQKYGLS